MHLCTEISSLFDLFTLPKRFRLGTWFGTPEYSTPPMPPPNTIFPNPRPSIIDSQLEGAILTRRVCMCRQMSKHPLAYRDRSPRQMPGARSVENVPDVLNQGYLGARRADRTMIQGSSSTSVLVFHWERAIQSREHLRSRRRDTSHPEARRSAR